MIQSCYVCRHFRQQEVVSCNILAESMGTFIYLQDSDWLQLIWTTITYNFNLYLTYGVFLLLGQPTSKVSKTLTVGAGIGGALTLTVGVIAVAYLVKAKLLASKVAPINSVTKTGTGTSPVADNGPARVNNRVIRDMTPVCSD